MYFGTFFGYKGTALLCYEVFLCFLSGTASGDEDEKKNKIRGTYF